MAKGKISTSLKRFSKSVDDLTKRVSRGIPDNDKAECHVFGEILVKKMASLSREIRKKK